MVRYRAILTVLLVPIAALVVVGCLYRGYFTECSRAPPPS